MSDTSTPTIDILDTSQKLGEQWVSAVKQSQSVTLDVVRALTEALPSVPGLAKIPGADTLPDVPAITAYGFDLATELLAAQKDFALKLTTALTPGK